MRPGTERGAGEDGAATGWLLGTQTWPGLDKCAETDEHDVRVRRSVVGLPLCQWVPSLFCQPAASSMRATYSSGSSPAAEPMVVAASSSRPA
jgi:hypothetical protein